MSGIGDADLVPVRSFEELRAGMTVVVKSCIEAGGRTVSMLLTAQDGGVCTRTGVRGFTCAPNYGDAAAQGWCFCGSLLEGKLYRLRDLDDAAEEGRRIGCDIEDRRLTLARKLATAGRAR